MKSRIIKIILVVCLICSVALAVTACKGVKMTISFVVDGQTYATIDTSGNEVVSIPQSPTKDGYTFDGWYWDDGTWQRPFTASSLLNEPLTSNMSVYAKFTEIHKHTYSAEWSKDERGHWHVATCEHTNETTAIEKHVYDSNYVCKICHYQDTSLHGTAIATEVFEINGETLYAKTPNTQTTFSFINAIQVADAATFVVATDLAANNVIRTKTVSLDIGDNTYYILVENGSDIQLYTVTLRRRPIYTVTFATNGGTACGSQQVEEDSLITKPTTSKTGYTFANWDYDFATPVTQNTTITASWTANKYNVTYDVNGGILTDTKYTATYDRAYTFAVPTKEGHTFQGWYIDKTQITDVNGQSIVNWTYTENKTATAKWTINSYILTINNPNSNAGTVTGDGTYVYDSEVTVTASEPNIGYDWLGWYDGDELITTELAHTFNMPLTAVSLIANYNVWDEMTNFDFTSTATTCTITGVKNTTITEVIIPDCVTSIDNDAFHNCCNITHITVGNKITNIGSYAFSDCKSLTNVNIKSIEFWCKIQGLGNLMSYGSGNKTFSINGNPITELIVPDSVTAIPPFAFQCITNIRRVTISNGVNDIGQYAFSRCESLVSITIPSSVNIIHNYAFSSCGNLSDINYLGTIDDWCKIKGLEYLMGWGSQSSRLSISGESLTELIIPDTVTVIPSFAFRHCSNLTSIVISNSVTSISASAFSDCNSLISVTIPDSVTRIDNCAFSGCSSLTSIVIPQSVTFIVSNAFYSCSNLTVYCEAQSKPSGWNNYWSNGVKEVVWGYQQ